MNKIFYWLYTKALILLEDMEFSVEGTKCTEIHRILSTAWPNQCPSVRRIQQILKQFEGGMNSRTRKTHSSELRENSIQRVEEAVEDDKDL